MFRGLKAFGFISTVYVNIGVSGPACPCLFLHEHSDLLRHTCIHLFASFAADCLHGSTVCYLGTRIYETHYLFNYITPNFHLKN
jgi:hypothetical protein